MVKTKYVYGVTARKLIGGKVYSTKRKAATQLTKAKKNKSNYRPNIHKFKVVTKGGGR